MTFQSVLYLVFLTIVFVGAAICRHVSTKQLALLFASYLFYASWIPVMLVVLVTTSLLNYWWGQVVRARRQSHVLWVGIAANVCLLSLFKYGVPLLTAIGIQPSGWKNVAAPVGLSFYTFQAISYLIDTYRHDEQPKPTLLEFLLYMAFWPTVLAGPVCRVGEIVPQLRALRTPEYGDVAEGSRRILIGLLMKVVVADTIGFGLSASEGVNSGFDSISEGWGALDVWCLAIGYGFQLFFDFAGYSHIAIGSARLFGLRLRENFDHPYLSTSPTEFWNRWHMSLSSWIRDYVFFPLAMLRSERSWRYASLLLAMTLFGMWHGNGITFILWGLYQGILLAGSRLLQQWWVRTEGQRTSAITRTAVPLAAWAATFALISLGWVLFRANTMNQALTMLRTVADPESYLRLALRLNFYVVVAAVFVGYFAFGGLRIVLSRIRTPSLVGQWRWTISPALYSVMIVTVIVWSRQAVSFVYTQF